MILIGCYSSEMNFTAPAPGLLPSFSALVNIIIPADRVFHKFTLKVIKEGQNESMEILSIDAEVPQSTLDEIALDSDPSVQGDERVLSLTMPLHWTSLVIDKPGFIKIRLKLDTGEEVKAGSLKINFPTELG